MELLIPGLILVALMVYASTRIKRSASRAFDEERITGKGFSLTKPEGFLHRIDNESEYEFEAYSKDFGTGTAEDIRAATAVMIISDLALEQAVSAEQARLTTVTESSETNGAKQISGELIRNGHSYNVFAKSLPLNGQTATLRIEVLKAKLSELQSKTQVLLDSFRSQ